MSWQSRGGCRSWLWRWLRNLFEDGTAGANSLICAQHHGHRAQHEHDRAPRGGLGKNVSRATRAESRLAAGAAEGSGEISGFAALQQHYDDQHQAV